MTDRDLIRLDAVMYAWPEMPMRFDLTVKSGQLVIVTGPSGSGKSTMLNLIAGFEQASGGKILIDNKDMTDLFPEVRPVSFLFQDNNLFSHLTVEQNAALGLKPSLRLSAEEKAKVREALSACGLDGKQKRLPSELSGGERQRAGLARVLLQDRPILLLDEPFAALGPALRSEMTDLLKSIQREKGMTVLAVTHHPEEWELVADGFVFVENGMIAATGPMKNLQKGSKGLSEYLGDRIR